MRLSWNEVRVRASTFANEWKDAHYEKGEAQTFYNEFFEIFGVLRRKVASFEEPVKKAGSKAPGFVDLLWKGTLLVEQKSAGRDLTKAKAQAFDYFPGLKDYELPRYVLVSDFQNFELYDLESGVEVKFKLQDLPKYVQAFSFVFGGTPRTFRDQDPVNIAASELMGQLHDSLRDSGFVGHDLERFLVRLVFCLFADDTGIFAPKGIFEDLIRDRTSADGSDLGPHLAMLFEMLNCTVEKRPKTLDEDLKQFPYINGELFAERLGMPAFDSTMRKKLLDACAFDWSSISPAIFGALFQSVMDKKKRRAIGAHYTTEQNILKVIQPLFLDDLRKELDAIKLRRDTAQHNALRVFQKKLSEIRCFDPACGCGNFLVIAYRELRALETEVLLALNKNRELDVADLSKVDVNQFYGIELEEFPARIAEIALWMMDHIMNMRLSEALGGYFPRIPLIKSPTIQATDALEVDWREILKPEVCSYVLGNPPFAGAKYQSPKQRAQVAKIANLTGKQGTLDLVAAWFIKAAQYIQGSRCHIGFVATNSITQGEQVGELWPLLFARHQLTISYAHRTFAWGSEVRGKANVHVVIVGLSSKGQEPANKRLFDYPDITGSPSETTVSVISPYLFDAGGLSNPETVVLETSATPSGLPRMLSGTQPIDFEQYVMDDSQRDELIAKEPKADRFIRPYIGSDGFINGERSWILALQKASPSELKEMPEVLRRMQTVTAKRLESTRPQTNRIAKTPSLYGVTVAPLSQFLVVPKVSSSRREYVPIAYLNPPTIPSDLVFVIENATPWLFGMLTSKMHMSWLSNIGGRLKSDYRYSIGLVYNAFPWPASAIDAELTKLAEAILDARTEHPSETLAGLYDPNTMPVKLRRAHERLDGYVDRLYRKEPFASDRQRAEFLMTRYEKEMAPLFPVKSVKSKRQKKLLAN